LPPAVRPLVSCAARKRAFWGMHAGMTFARPIHDAETSDTRFSVGQWSRSNPLRGTCSDRFARSRRCRKGGEFLMSATRSTGVHVAGLAYLPLGSVRAAVVCKPRSSAKLGLPPRYGRFQRNLSGRLDLTGWLTGRDQAWGDYPFEVGVVGH